MQHQQEDKSLLAAAQRNKSYAVKNFTTACWVCKLICLHGKTVVPKIVQKQVVQWYHVQLCHPGETRTEQKICQHFTWGRIVKTVKTVCASCAMWKITKTKTVKYGKLPAEKAKTNP